jgi:chorismate mutase / prephenate dehydrogenase
MANKGPNEPALPKIRERLDLLDREILERLAERQRLVLEVAADKRRRGLAIRDVEREREVLASRRAEADALGFPGNIAESIWRLIMLASREQQSAQKPAPKAEVDRKVIAIIGGAGQMGQLLTRFFGEYGHEIVIADTDTALSPVEAASRADVVIVSVPIRETERVIREVGPHVRQDALLMDITSLKAAPVRAMLESTEASVIGTHPMFGPGVRAFEGQRVVLCVGRDREDSPWLDWLKKHFRAHGMFLNETDPEHHDRVMSIVQVLLHYQTQVLGLTLANTSMPLEESLAFTSPAYLLEVYVAARHFAQDSALYGPIEMENPSTREIVDAFRAAADEIGEMLARGDQAQFDAVFEKVRAYFGEFTSEALEQSGFLIDRLIELTTGRAAMQS